MEFQLMLEKKSFDGGLEKESEMRDAAALDGEGGEASAFFE